MLERVGLLVWWGALVVAVFLVLYGLGLALSVGIAAHGIVSFFAVIMLSLIVGRAILFALSGY